MDHPSIAAAPVPGQFSGLDSSTAAFRNPDPNGVLGSLAVNIVLPLLSPLPPALDVASGVLPVGA
jgi:hypothetical protein